MKFAVLFEDDPATDPDIRKTHMTAHLEFLEANQTRIEAAGPLPSYGENAGGLWIVEAPDAAAVETLVHADPFWPTGLRKSVQVLAWKQVFAGGRRLI